MLLILINFGVLLYIPFLMQISARYLYLQLNIFFRKNLHRVRHYDAAKMLRRIGRFQILEKCAQPCDVRLCIFLCEGARMLLNQIVVGRKIDIIQLLLHARSLNPRPERDPLISQDKLIGKIALIFLRKFSRYQRIPGQSGPLDERTVFRLTPFFLRPENIRGCKAEDQKQKYGIQIDGLMFFHFFILPESSSQNLKYRNGL